MAEARQERGVDECARGVDPLDPQPVEDRLEAFDGVVRGTHDPRSQPAQQRGQRAGEWPAADDAHGAPRERQIGARRQGQHHLFGAESAVQDAEHPRRERIGRRRIVRDVDAELSDEGRAPGRGESGESSAVGEDPGIERAGAEQASRQGEGVDERGGGGGL
ncbi:hypothetical protein HR12_01335 [Microbacterium sp. SUBG005]|nr:hypothetical protein HR12_01335 [Microbacterium sp. SUBG005]